MRRIDRYYEIVKKLAVEYGNSGELDKIDMTDDGFWVSPYEEAVKQNPKLAEVTEKFNDKENYEVSYNQCCLALRHNS